MIYAIFVLGTNKVYVGRSNDADRRFYVHCWELARGEHHCKPLQDVYTGNDGLSMRVVDPIANDNAAEVALMRYYSRRGYEVLNVMSGATWGEYMSAKFQNNPARSAAIAKANTERWADEDYRAKMSEKFKVLYNTPEYIAKQKQSHPGKPFYLHKDGVIVGYYDSQLDCQKETGISTGNLSCHLRRKPGYNSVKGFKANYA